MKDRPPVLDVIECKTLPTRCPACAATDPQSDGKWPETTRVSCRCGWFARYRLRQAEPDRV